MRRNLIRFLALIWLFGLNALPAYAQEAARVVMLTGSASAQAPNAKPRPLAKDSVLHPGDTVQTDRNATLRLRFADASEITLQADTRISIDQFKYNDADPGADRLVLDFIKGGLRAISGAIGKRGNPDAYELRTQAGNIGIRGTDYALLICGAHDAACGELHVPSDFGDNSVRLLEGLYVYVFEGVIRAANESGAKEWHAGKSGYVRDRYTLPRVLSDDPGLRGKFQKLREAGEREREPEVDQDKLRRLKKRLKQRAD